MKTGRNDPCPCGSGKKYKQCCLNKQDPQQAEDILWHQIRRSINGLPEKLLKFSVKHFGQEAIFEAWEEFMPLEEEFSPETPHMQLFMPWLFYNWTPDLIQSDVTADERDDRTIAQIYLEKYGKQLEPLLRRYIEQCCIAPFSFYDIVSIRPGNGFLLRDIMTNEEIYASERSGSQQAQVGQIVFGKLVKIDHVAILEASASTFIPPLEKRPILHLRKAILAQEDPPSQALIWKYDYEMLETYHEIYDRLHNPQTPELSNTDGDILQFHKLIYDIPSAQSAFDALKQLNIVSNEQELLADAKYDSEGNLEQIAFPWHKEGNLKHKSWTNTILGRINIEGHQLTVEVNSEQRAQQFRQLAEKLMPEAHYKTSVIESAQAMLARKNNETGNDVSPKEFEAMKNHPEVQSHITEVLREHYRLWPEEALPALDGQTPLEAVKTKDGREMVEALLLDFEQRNERSGTPMDPSILAELRTRLGLNDN